MKKIFLTVFILFFANVVIAQKLIEKYYPVSTILKETGTLNKNGFPIGEWKYYTQNETLDYKINWDINFIKMYYATGELKETGTFIPETGAHIGQWTTYCEDGKIDDKALYDKKGKLIKNL